MVERAEDHQEHEREDDAGDGGAPVSPESALLVEDLPPGKAYVLLQGERGGGHANASCRVSAVRAR